MSKPSFFDASKKFLPIIVVILLVGAGWFYYSGQKNRQTGLPDQTAKQQEETAKPQESDSVKENIEVPKETADSLSPVRAIDDSDHLAGDKNAPVKLIVYSDFECPFCGKYFDTLEQVKNEFGDKVAIAFRHFPLLNLHVYAMQAAIASECAAEQDKFWPMHDRLFADNKENKINEAQFKEDAKTIGLDQAKFNQCLATEKYKDKVTAQMIEAKNFNVNGTPTTFVNDRIVVGAYPFEDFTATDGVKTEGMKSIISKALNK
jgi:protein-disulfide isomerase